MWALQFTKASHNSHSQGQNENWDISVCTIFSTLPKMAVCIYIAFPVMTSDVLYHLPLNYFDPSLCFKSPRSIERFSDLLLKKKKKKKKKPNPSPEEFRCLWKSAFRTKNFLWFYSRTKLDRHFSNFRIYHLKLLLKILIINWENTAIRKC